MVQFGAFWGLRRAFLTNENPFCQNNVDSAAYSRIGSYAPERWYVGTNAIRHLVYAVISGSPYHSGTFSKPAHWKCTHEQSTKNIENTPEQLNEWRITQNNVYSVVCCQMTSYFEKQKCLTKKKKDWWLFTGSLVEIEYTLNCHPLTRVMYLRTLRDVSFIAA